MPASSQWMEARSPGGRNPLLTDGPTMGYPAHGEPPPANVIQRALAWPGTCKAAGAP